MAEPQKQQAMFKYRHVNGVTELKIRDNPDDRRALAKEFLGFHGLLEGHEGGQATFEQLRSVPEFCAFIEGEGKGMDAMLYVLAENGSITMRAILVSSAPGKVRARVSWDNESGFQFETFCAGP